MSTWIRLSDLDESVLFEGFVADDITPLELAHWPTVRPCAPKGLEENAFFKDSTETDYIVDGDSDFVLSARIQFVSNKGVLSRCATVTSLPHDILKLSVYKLVGDLSWWDLYDFPHLTHVWMNRCHLKSFPEFVGKLSSLVKLELSDNDISVIPSTLLSLSRLQEFHVGGNFLGGQHEESNMMTVAAAINDLPSLTSLSLNRCEITAYGVKILSTHIQKKTCVLKSLDLSNNRLGDEGCQHLAQLVKCKMRSLKTLRVKLCDFYAPGAKSLFGASSMTLEALDVSFNEIQEGGLEALISLLKQSTKLRNLRAFGLGLSAPQHQQLIHGLEWSWSLRDGMIDPMHEGQHEDVVFAVSDRNLSLYENVRHCCVLLAATHRFRGGGLGRDCGTLVAKALYNTRLDGASWFQK